MQRWKSSKWTPSAQPTPHSSSSERPVKLEPGLVEERAQPVGARHPQQHRRGVGHVLEAALGLADLLFQRLARRRRSWRHPQLVRQRPDARRSRPRPTCASSPPAGRGCPRPPIRRARRAPAPTPGARRRPRRARRRSRPAGSRRDRAPSRRRRPGRSDRARAWHPDSAPRTPRPSRTSPAASRSACAAAATPDRACHSCLPESPNPGRSRRSIAIR